MRGSWAVGVCGIDLGAAVLRPDHVGGLLVEVVLDREVLAPHRRVLGVVGDLDDAHDRVLRLLLLLRDADEQRGREHGGERERARRRVRYIQVRFRGAGLSAVMSFSLGEAGGISGGGRRSRGSGCRRPRRGRRPGHRQDELGVAGAALPLDDVAALRARADHVGEAADRERHRVVVAVRRLGDVARGAVRACGSRCRSRPRGATPSASPSSCPLITWQFAQVAGSLPRYEVPFA